MRLLISIIGFISLTGCMSFTRHVESGTIDPNSIKVYCGEQCFDELQRRVLLLELYVEQLQAKQHQIISIPMSDHGGN